MEEEEEVEDGLFWRWKLCCDNEKFLVWSEILAQCWTLKLSRETFAKTSSYFGLGFDSQCVRNSFLSFLPVSSIFFEQSPLVS